MRWSKAPSCGWRPGADQRAVDGVIDGSSSLGGRYDRDLRDVLSMQEEVTLAIVGEIRVKLTAQEQARLVNSAPD